MTEAEQTVKSMFDAVLTGDIATVMAAIDADIEVLEPPSLAYGGVHRGADAFRDNVLGAILAKMQMQISRVELLPAGDRVAAVMDIEFTSHKTGRRLVMPYVEVYTVVARKVRRIAVYPQDTAALNEFWKAN